MKSLTDIARMSRVEPGIDRALTGVRVVVPGPEPPGRSIAGSQHQDREQRRCDGLEPRSGQQHPPVECLPRRIKDRRILFLDDAIAMESIRLWSRESGNGAKRLSLLRGHIGRNMQYYDWRPVSLSERVFTHYFDLLLRALSRRLTFSIESREVSVSLIRETYINFIYFFIAASQTRLAILCNFTIRSPTYDCKENSMG